MRAAYTAHDLSPTVSAASAEPNAPTRSSATAGPSDPTQRAAISSQPNHEAAQGASRQPPRTRRPVIRRPAVIAAATVAVVLLAVVATISLWPRGTQTHTSNDRPPEFTTPSSTASTTVNQSSEPIAPLPPAIASSGRLLVGTNVPYALRVRVS
jgi:hypothetical protein